MTRQLQLLSHTCPCGLKLLEKSHKKLVSWPMLIYDFFFFFFLLAFLPFLGLLGSLEGVPRGGGSQARGLIRAAAACLRQSHSNAGSELCL